MTAPDKTPPAGPLRAALPPVYPIPLIEVACRALEAVAQFDPVALFAVGGNEVRDSALRIIRDGLLSHEREAAEGRSRG